MAVLPFGRVRSRSSSDSPRQVRRRALAANRFPASVGGASGWQKGSPEGWADPDPRDLVKASVTPATLKQYTAEVEEFEARDRHRGRLNPFEKADATLKQYMEFPHQERESPQVGRLALFGLLLLRFPSPGRGMQTLPLSRAAFRGWAKLQPGKIRDPAPLEVAWAIAACLLENAENGDLWAAAVVLQVECYLRPGALLAIRRPDVIAPLRVSRSTRLALWCLPQAPEQAGPRRASRTTP